MDEFSAPTQSMTFESLYRDIVRNERIVYTSMLHGGDDLTTVAFCPAGGARGCGHLAGDSAARH
ncbi:hypothetical protein AB0K48_61225, partial [Nonomuraea sp. NPDC055795]